jgi:hypothetical protein
MALGIGPGQRRTSWTTLQEEEEEMKELGTAMPS